MRQWDPDQDPALGLEAIHADTLRDRHALLLVAGAGARDDGWAHGAAIALARSLSDHGRRVVLADLDFSAPGLHAGLGEPNAEGMSDVFFFGASLEHVALTESARPFAIIPTGAGVTDPGAMLEHPGWARLLARFDATIDPTGDLLLGFVPAQAPGLATLARSIGAAIALGLEHECTGIRTALPAGVALLASFAPETLTQGIPLGRGILVPRPMVGGPDGPAAALPRERDMAAAAAVIDDAAVVSPAERGDASRRQLARGLTLVAMLLLSALVGVWHFHATGTPGRDRAIDPPPAAAQATRAGPPVPTAGLASGEGLPYAVAIEMHEDMAAATRRVESLDREAPAVGFFITPLVVDDAIAYRILAGPVRDSATAAGLMDWLVENGHTTGRSEWGIRPRPYAFLIGEYEGRDQAEQRRAQIAELDIPSYVLEMPYADSAPSRFLLYAGAYSGAAEAELMRQLLRAEGLADTLVERRGRSPQ